VRKAKKRRWANEKPPDGRRTGKGTWERRGETEEDRHNGQRATRTGRRERFPEGWMGWTRSREERRGTSRLPLSSCRDSPSWREKKRQVECHRWPRQKDALDVVTSATAHLPRILSFPRYGRSSPLAPRFPPRTLCTPSIACAVEEQEHCVAVVVLACARMAKKKERGEKNEDETRRARHGRSPPLSC